MRRPYPTKLSPYGPGLGVFPHRRGHLFVTRALSHKRVDCLEFSAKIAVNKQFLAEY
jgi:hypothetical protein